jgi:hypothetical protein
MTRDPRYAVRTLLRSPGFTATALLSIALGIGASTAIFSLVDRVLLRPAGNCQPRATCVARVERQRARPRMGDGLRHVLSNAALMIAAGLAVALPAAWALRRLVEAQLFGVSAEAMRL